MIHYAWAYSFDSQCIFVKNKNFTDMYRNNGFRMILAKPVSEMNSNVDVNV